MFVIGITSAERGQKHKLKSIGKNDQYAACVPTHPDRARSCQYWTISCACGSTENAPRNLSCWLKLRTRPMCGFVTALSQVIIGSSSSARRKQIKLGWPNSLSKLGFNVNRQRQKQACQRPLTLFLPTLRDLMPKTGHFQIQQAFLRGWGRLS